MNELRVKTRRQWRRWLQKNHTTSKEVWLVFHKRHTGMPNIPYDAAVEEALCFGWIDSLIKKLDDERYARKFTPRSPGSVWSESNKRRAAKMMRQGQMTEAGLVRIEEARSSGEWRRVRSRPQAAALVKRIPAELSVAFADHPRAKVNFLAMAPSYRKQYVMWIASAKRPATRRRRTREAIEKLERAERLGLK